MPVLKYRPSVGAPWQVVGITGQNIGIFPQIIVTAPTGSTVTCSKGSTVLHAEEVEGTWTFNVPEYGEWILTCTNEYGVTTKNIIIDCVKIYNASIDSMIVNYTMLYDGSLGDVKLNECSEITGGYTYIDLPYASGYSYTGDHYGTKGASSLKIRNYTTTDNCWQQNAYYTNNPIMLSGYSKCMAKIRTESCAAYYPQLGFTKTLKSYFSELTFETIKSSGFTSNSNTFTKFYNIDVSNIDSSYLMFINGARGSSSEGYGGNAYLDSMVLVKEDDWQTWITKAGLSTDTYSTLDGVLIDNTAVTTLLNSLPAVKYMIMVCTGTVMASAIQSSTFLTALESSPYKDLVYANEHWAKFLAMVQ